MNQFWQYERHKLPHSPEQHPHRSGRLRADLRRQGLRRRAASAARLTPPMGRQMQPATTAGTSSRSACRWPSLPKTPRTARQEPGPIPWKCPISFRERRRFPPSNPRHVAPALPFHAHNSRSPAPTTQPPGSRVNATTALTLHRRANRHSSFKPQSRRAAARLNHPRLSPGGPSFPIVAATRGPTENIRASPDIAITASVSLPKRQL